MRKLYAILLVGFVLRLLLTPFFTYQLDFNTFIAWGNIAREVGLSSFYSSTWSDYLPGYLYVLRFLSGVNQLEILPKTLLYKLPAIIADTLTGFLVYKIVISQIVIKKHKQELALLATGVYIFNPAVLANSTFWGQVDSFTSLFSLASLYLLKSNPIFSAVFLGVGALVKPQIAMVLPVLLALMIKKKWKIKKMALYGAITAAVLLVGFLPFSDNLNLIAFMQERISTTINQYQYGSVNAFNFWGLFGFWKPDNVGFWSTKRIGDMFVAILSLFTLRKLLKDRDENKNYLALTLLFMLNFFFMTRMHERHMLPIFAPMAIAMVSAHILAPLYALFSVTYLANMYYGYTYVSTDRSLVLTSGMIKVIIIINLLAFASVAFVFFKNKHKFNLISFDLNSFFKKQRRVANKKIKDYLNKHQTKKLLYVIIFFSLITRLFFLGTPERDYFDEIYHAFTARTLVDNDPGVWDWGIDHPEGFAYEWTHPPLNKEIMAVSMKIIGVNSLAWRLPGALLGVGIVILTFKIALALTKSRDIAILSAALVSLDGLVFTMSRIGTGDVYFVFFVLLSFWAYLKDKYLFSSLALGMAISTKWSAVWFLPVLVVAHLSLRRSTFDKRLIYFFTIPIAIYLLSYTPMFLHGYDLGHFWGMQKQMWWYHSGLEATHPYTSQWWSWPIMERPVYLYQLDNNDGKLGNIYAMGNPLVFWFGLISVISSFYYLIKRKAPKQLGIALFAYLAFFVPWAGSPRIMFIYHYLPSVPFMAILSGYILKKHAWLIMPVTLTSFILFVYFYPHWIGLAIPENLSQSYYWLSSWR